MNSSPQTVPWLTRLERKLFASRFVTFSLLVHVMILILGGSIIIAQKPLPDDLPPTAKIEMPDTEVVREITCVGPPTTEVTLAIMPPKTLSLDSIVRHVDMDSHFALAVTTGAAKRTEGVSDFPDTPTGPSEVGSAFRSPVMINRIGEDRMNVLKRRGGSEATEAAVLGGLRWLKKTQNQDGSWGDEYKASMTGLALLAFLGHGEDQTSPEFGPAVGGAVEWLRVAGRDFEGRLSLTKDGWGSGMGAVYEHAIATYALADYYGLTGDARVEPLLRQAIGHIVAGQAPDGGWNYSYAKKPNSDTSVSGWQIQALISAHHSRLVIKGVDEALDKAMVNLKRVQSEDGNFHYQKLGDRGDNSSLAGVGALCSAVWHTGGSERLGNKGAKFLLESNRRGLDYRSETADLYAWYYHAQACSAVGGTPWTKWNRLFRDVIVNAQSPEGNWPPTQGRSPGGELQRKPDGAGPVYRTALCVLMLETYYRNVF